MAAATAAEQMDSHEGYLEKKTAMALSAEVSI